MILKTLEKYPIRCLTKISLFFFFTLTIIHAQVPYPKVTFKYDWGGKCLDYLLYLTGKCKKVDKSTKDHFEKDFPKFITIWNEKAPILFGEVSSFFKRGFNQKNRTAILSLGVPYGGYGSSNFLFFCIGSFIDQTPSKLNVSREDTFVDLVFHELLHIWTEDNIKESTQLLIKYRNERSAVRNHIHLMAIQKMVYHKLNRPNIIEMLDEHYRLFAPIDSDYRRAWEIVNDIEGYEVVIQDILNNL